MKGKWKTQKTMDQSERRIPPCTLLHTAVQVRKVVLRNRWSGIVLGYRRVSAQNCPSFPCSASRSRSRAHWFERAGSYVNIRRIEYTVHSDRFRCAFLQTIGMCPLESLLHRFNVSFDTWMTSRPKISSIGLISCVRFLFTSSNSGVCSREIAYSKSRSIKKDFN